MGRSFSFIKCLWFAILIVCFIGSFKKIMKFYYLYFEYPIIMNIRMERQQNLTFPAVTVCNLNRMKRIPTQRKKPIYIEGQPPLIFSEGRMVQRSRTSLQSPTVKFLNDYYKMSEAERFRNGHQPSDFIQKCIFDGGLCSEFNLHIYTSFRFGNCVTFNKRISSPRPHRQDPIKEFHRQDPIKKFHRQDRHTTKTGVGTGLILNLNLEIGYYLSLTHTIGAKVVVHDPTDMPNLEEEGFIVSPGSETLVSLKQTVVRRLPAPYKDRCFDYNNQVDPAMVSKNACVRKCIQDKNFAKCGCIDLTLSAGNNLRPCDVMNETEMRCLDDVLGNMSRAGSKCKCPLPCSSISYNEMPSKAYLLPNVFFMKKNNKTDSNRRKLKWKKENIRMNIFYSNLEQTIYEQKPKWEDVELVCYFGNQLGLWLGLSFAAFVGISEKLLSVFRQFTSYKSRFGK